MVGAGAAEEHAEPGAAPASRMRRGLVFAALPVIAVLAGVAGALALEHRDSLVQERRLETREVAVAAATNARRFLGDQLATLGAVAAAPSVRGADLPALRDYLPMVAQAGRFSAGVSYVDTAGVVQASSTSNERVSVADRPYVRAALDENRPAASGVLIGRAATRPVIAFGYPVTDLQGDPGGLLVGAVALDRIDEVLRRLSYAPISGTTILDGDGNVIVGPRGPVRGLEAPPPGYPVAAARARGEGVLDVQTGEGERLIGFAPVPGTDWIVLVDRDRGDLIGPLDAALYAELAALALLALFGVLATLAVARRLQALDRERDAALSEQRTIAVRLQRSMLPDLPAPQAVAVHGTYAPAQGALSVGGDWYDVVELDGGRVALTVGDVAGHGLPAAATMGQLRSAGRMLALDRSTPGDALSRLDQFARTLDGRPLATVVFAQVDPAAGRVRYACAGHPPPLVLRADGATEFLHDGRSTLLGVDPGEPRPEGETALAPGDTLVLYTDGLIEQPGRSLDDGMAALARRAREHAGEPSVLADALLAGVPEPRRDDSAVLCVRLSGSRETGSPAQPSSVAS